MEVLWDMWILPEIWIPVSPSVSRIRKTVKEKDTVYIQAGGGIVADSIPSQEYQESASKAMAVMQAVAGAGEVE